MDDFVWNLGTKYKYWYKKKVISRTGKEYWRYYPPKWGQGPIISRVKLKPEQAVLTCCDVAGSYPKISFFPSQNACGGTVNCQFGVGAAASS